MIVDSWGVDSQNASKAEVDLVDDGGFGGDEVAEAVGGVVAASAVFIGIDFEHVFRAVGIVL